MTFRHYTVRTAICRRSLSVDTERRQHRNSYYDFVYKLLLPLLLPNVRHCSKNNPLNLTFPGLSNIN